MLDSPAVQQLQSDSQHGPVFQLLSVLLAGDVQVTFVGTLLLSMQPDAHCNKLGPLVSNTFTGHWSGALVFMYNLPVTTTAHDIPVRRPLSRWRRTARGCLRWWAPPGRMC